MVSYNLSKKGGKTGEMVKGAPPFLDYVVEDFHHGY